MTPRISPKRRTVLAAALAATAMLATACGGPGASSAGETRPIKVGALLALTGTYSSLGETEKDSIQLYADTVNKAGGINGRKIELTIVDSRSDESQAVNQYRKLALQDQVDVVIGPSSSGEAVALRPITGSTKTPVIALASSKAIVNPRAESDYMFKQFPSALVSLRSQLQYVQSKGLKRVALLRVNSAYGEEPAGYLKEIKDEYGVEVVGESVFNGDATNVTSQLSSLAATNPEATLVWTVNPQSAIVAQNAAAINYPGALIMSTGAATEEYMKVGGAATDGTYVLGPKIAVAADVPSDDPQYSEIQRLIGLWGGQKLSVPNMNSANGWDGMLLLEQALKQVDPKLSDTKEVREAIRSNLETQVNGLPGVNAIYTFSPDAHGSEKPGGLAMLRVEGGKFALEAGL